MSTAESDVKEHIIRIQILSNRTWVSLYYWTVEHPVYLSNLYLKIEVHLYMYLMYLKWSTKVWPPTFLGYIGYYLGGLK